MSGENDAQHLCNHLGEEIYFANQNSQMKHNNRHIPPHQLVPRTLPNNLSKVGCSRVINVQDTTEQSSIAIRSILPEQLPRHSQDPKKINIITSPGGFVDNRPIKIGSDRIMYQNQPNDLSSNIVGTDIQRQSGQQLYIEKEIQLKPIKANIVKKQVHKLQSNHMAARQIIDMGKHEKKVQSAPLKDQRVGGGLNPFEQSGSTQEEPVYEIKDANKVSMWSALVGIVKPQNQPISVNFARKTGAANVFAPIQTKSNPQQKKIGRGLSSSESDYQPKAGKYLNEKEEIQDPSQRNVGGLGDQSRKRQPHPHECPSCHGFYCPHCKSNVPAKYRPFWDQNQSPQLIAQYKKAQQQARKNKCPECYKE